MTETHKPVGVVVLAAGASRRMKRPKQLLKFEGKTLVRRAAETALGAHCKIVCVVLGAHAEKIKAEISDLPVEIAVNDNWRAGMGASLQAGLKKLLAIEPELSAAVVMLCDQPFVDSALIVRLIRKFQAGKSPVAACEYAGTTGVPAIFSRELFDEILRLPAEGGAKTLFEKYTDAIEKIRAPGAVFDVDTPCDYEDLIAKSDASGG